MSDEQLTSSRSGSRRVRNRYVLISPCKDESKYLERTLESVGAQTITPAQWVIVDDGSKDDTPVILERYREKLPYLRVVRRTVPSARRLGSGVIEAFNVGLAAVDADYDFLCKLDVDLDLPPTYFETLMDRMNQDPTIGSCSGKPYFVDERTGKLRSELCGDDMSVGMAKFYRRACFEEIGGFVPQVGWDGYDCHLCRWLGWKAVSWPDSQLKFIHLRPMGSSHKSIMHGRVRHGKGQYYIGTHPLFFMASSIYRSFLQRPYVIGTLCSIYGYAQSAIRREPHFGSPELVQFIRKYQLNALRYGKKRASEIARQSHHSSVRFT